MRSRFRPPRWPLLSLLLATVLTLFTSARSARAADDPQTFEEWRATADGVVSVQNTATTDKDGKFHAKVVLQALDGKLGKKGKAIDVYDGPFVITRLAVKGDVAAVLMYRGGGAPFVKVALVDVSLGTTKTIDLPRTAPKGHVPTSSIACADADGFTLVWQEQDPLQSYSVHTTMARVKTDGTIVKKPTAATGIVWALGAIVATDTGYMLAVRYDGSAPDQTRICFVTLNADGAPQEHPWWGSKPAQVNEIQMRVVGGEVKAIYRAGKGPESILEVTVDKTTGQWGKEAPDAKVLAAKVASGPFAVRTKGGAIEIVHR